MGVVHRGSWKRGELWDTIRRLAKSMLGRPRCVTFRFFTIDRGTVSTVIAILIAPYLSIIASLSRLANDAISVAPIVPREALFMISPVEDYLANDKVLIAEFFLGSAALFYTTLTTIFTG